MIIVYNILFGRLLMQNGTERMLRVKTVEICIYVDPRQTKKRCREIPAILNHGLATSQQA